MFSEQPAPNRPNSSRLTRNKVSEANASHSSVQEDWCVATQLARCECKFIPVSGGRGIQRYNIPHTHSYTLMSKPPPHGVSISSSSPMMKQLDWAQRMVRDDDHAARAQLERELFARTADQDDHIMRMLNEKQHRAVPVHPLAETEAYATASGKTVEVASSVTLKRSRALSISASKRPIDEQIRDTLVLIRGPSVSTAADPSVPGDDSVRGSRSPVDSGRGEIGADEASPSELVTSSDLFPPRAALAKPVQVVAASPSPRSGCTKLRHSLRKSPSPPKPSIVASLPLNCHRPPVEFPGVGDLLSRREATRRTAAHLSEALDLFPTLHALQFASNGCNKLDAEDASIAQHTFRLTKSFTSQRVEIAAPALPAGSPAVVGDVAPDVVPRRASPMRDDGHGGDAPPWLPNPADTPSPTQPGARSQSLATTLSFGTGRKEYAVDISQQGLRDLIARVSDKLRISSVPPAAPSSIMRAGRVES